MSDPLTATPAETLLRRERLLLGLSLALICVLSWWYLLAGAGTGMSTLAMTTWEFPPPVYRSSGGSNWEIAYWLVMLCMWWVMMIAMMLPSAAPMIFLYARVVRHHKGSHAQAPLMVPTGSFLLGYLLCWLGFSLVATVLQWFLERAGLVHGMLMWSSSHALSATFLFAAGVYQLSPWKNTCLEHCRSPAGYLSSHWRNGRAGALRMGIEHGLYCVGCCWMLMLLLFVGGAMNLVWIAGLATLVLAEKLLPAGPAVVRLSALALFVAAGFLIYDM